ncbi:MAG: deoxyhypusine synthase family protein [Promethearchaeia archaeon]
MNKEKINDHKYLRKKIDPFDVEKVKNVADVLKSLQNCGFQGGNLGKALDVLYKMVSDEKILTVLTLSGAMVPAGMGEIICVLMEHGLIDVIISTGANISHDLIDAVADGGHYQGSAEVDDEDLFNYRINRIYDVFLPEDNYDLTEDVLLKIIQDSFDQKKIEMCVSEFLSIIGTQIKERCILSVAAERNTPIFVPAFTDSEFALNLAIYSEYKGYSFKFDMFEDLKKFAQIINNSEECGTFIIGGGVPRNWAQQIFPLLEHLKNVENRGYDYSVRIHTATELDGGLSGCTISESKSWGKYSLASKYVSVWCDATIALPILITALLQKLKLL